MKDSIDLPSTYLDTNQNMIKLLICIVFLHNAMYADKFGNTHHLE